MKKQLAYLFLQNIFAIFVFSVINICSATAQLRYSYMIPDIGTPGMNTYIEFVGIYNSNNCLGGGDGLLPNTILKIYPEKLSDTNRVIFSPAVISWNGKLISAHAFVKPNAALGAVPIIIENNGSKSNVDTFYIVAPQNISAQVNGGIIGEGTLGYRSKRGAMIVDSLVLLNGDYSISTKDPDNNVGNGNQGYLPFILISKGRVFIDQSVTISASATGKHGGPGGGGGGGYGPTRNPSGLPPIPIPGEADAPQGDGFTGGRSDVPAYGSPGPFGQGSGIGTTSLNKVNTSTDFSSNRIYGSGVGHPFDIDGRSGGAGQIKVGAGVPPVFQSLYFGGGGNATEGKGKIPLTDLNGQVIGNKMIVPLHGGGGGAGAALCDSIGGGGGGGIAIYSQKDVSIGIIKSDGARGRNGAETPGDGLCSDALLRGDASAGGAGGCVIVGSKVAIQISELSVSGGEAGTKSTSILQSVAGSGGAGRYRLDGKLLELPTLKTDSASKYLGISLDTVSVVSSRNWKFTGRGNKGDSVVIIIKGENSAWLDNTPFRGVVGKDSSFSVLVNLPNTDSNFYLVAYQKVNSTDLQSQTNVTKCPTLITTQSAAAYVKVVLVPELFCDKIKNLGTVKCSETITDSILVFNKGSVDLKITKADFVGTFLTEYKFKNVTFPVVIKPQDSVFMPFSWSNNSNTNGDKSVTLSLTTNDNRNGFNPYNININLVKDIFKATINTNLIAVGKLNFLKKSTFKLVYQNRGNTADTIKSVTEIFTSNFPKQIQLLNAPVVANPNKDTDLNFEFTPLDTGSFELKYKLDVFPCVLDTTFVIKGYAGNASITSNPELELLGTSCNDTLTGSTYVKNVGSDILKIDAIAFAGTGDMTIISPTKFPVFVSINDSVKIDLKIIKVSGVVQGKILLSNNDSMPDKNPYPINLKTDIKTLSGLSNNNIDFGAVNINTKTPFQLVLTNSSANEYKIINADIFPANADISLLAGQIPNTIYPNSTTKLILEFDAKNSYKIQNTFLRLFISSPCSDTILTPISGEAFDGGVFLNKTSVSFGKLLSCEVKFDTVTIRNTNVKPVTIKLFNLNPVVANQDWATLPSNLLPKIIQPNDSLTFVVEYSPVSFGDGKKDAVLVIQTDDPNRTEITLDLIGEKITENMSYKGEFYDTIVIGKSQTRNHFIKNVGSTPIQVTGLSINTPFKIISVSKPIPFTLDIDETVTVEIEFTPTDTLLAVDSLHIQTLNKCLKQINSKVTALGYNPEGTKLFAKWLDNVIPIGKTVKIPLVLAADLNGVYITKMQLKMNFNNKLFKPTRILKSGTMISDWNISAINSSVDGIEFTTSGLGLNLLARDTILFVEGVGLLGDTDECVVTGLGSVINEGRVKFENSNGSLKIVGHCPIGAKRLVSTSSEFLIKSISPNPIVNNAEIEVSTNEDTETKLLIYNLNAELVITLCNEYLETGTYKFQIPVSKLPSGLYRIEFSTNNQKQSKKIIINK